MVRSRETPGDKYEQEIEQLKSEKADLEGKKEGAELWLQLCQTLSTEIWKKRLSREKLVAQAFGHRDAALNDLFQAAILDIWGAKFKLYFGNSYVVSTVAEGVGPLKPQHSFTSCLNACSTDDDCKAADYDPRYPGMSHCVRMELHWKHYSRHLRRQKHQCYPGRTEMGTCCGEQSLQSPRRHLSGFLILLKLLTIQFQIID
jgi:hypothetical protein